MTISLRGNSHHCNTTRLRSWYTTGVMYTVPVSYCVLWALDDGYTLHMVYCSLFKCTCYMMIITLAQKSRVQQQKCGNIQKIQRTLHQICGEMAGSLEHSHAHDIIWRERESKVNVSQFCRPQLCCASLGFVVTKDAATVVSMH